MCGILGLWSTNANRNLPNLEQFRNALNEQSHRGPDASGIEHFETALLGHRRLSIIDLNSESNQPLYSHCGQYCIVFNGELYNYKELRERLVSNGAQFLTNSDTEVILNSFIQDGVSCIDNFIGMFVFAIYDLQKNIIHLVRDRLGVKPCYYVHQNGIFAFSSDVRSLNTLMKSYPWWEATLNLSAVSSYFSFRYPILNDTFFEGIYELPQATYLQISNEGIDELQYWDPIDQFESQQNDHGETHYKQELAQLLESSVLYRMTSDVPVGSFLSGGVDSSIITAIMANCSDEKVLTFNVGFEDQGFNENNYANLIVDKFDTAHEFMEISHDAYVENIQNLVELKAAPLSIPNEIALFLLSQKIKKNATVVLSGEGADEIFMGYGRIFRSIFDYDRLHKEHVLFSDGRDKKFVDNMSLKYGNVDFKDEFSHFYECYPYASISEKKDIFSKSLPLTKIETQLKSKLRECFEHTKIDSYQVKMSYVFERIHLQGLLQRLDNSTMAASIEARSPFLDHRLVEFAWRLPEKYKLKWNDNIDTTDCDHLNSDQISEVYDTPKYLLKETFNDLIPDEILYRKKIGFPAPLTNILSGSALEGIRNILFSDEALARNLYDANWLELHLQPDVIQGDNSVALKIWMLVNLETFILSFMPHYKFTGCDDK